MKNKKILTLILTIILIIIAIGTHFIVQNIQKENRKYEIENISEYKYFVVKENSKYGVIDANGKKIIDTKYKDVKIPNPERAVFICYEEEKTKILNEKSEEIFTEYENIEPLRLKNISSDLMYEKSVLKYSKDGKYGIIDFNGRRLTKAIYDEIDTFQYKEGELLVKQEEKYGVININGTILVKTEYDKIETDKYYEDINGYRKDGYIVCNKTEDGYRYGYVNLEGKEIIDTKYNDLYRILEINSEDIYIICADNGKYGLIRNDKLIINNSYQSLTYSESSNTITALKGKKQGVMSLDGDIIVPIEYKQIDITGKIIYATTNDGDIKIFDTNGKEKEISPDLAIIDVNNTDYKIYIETIDGKTRYNIYKNETQATTKEYTYIQYLFENYFIVCNTDGNLGVIDDNENIRITFNYNSIQKIENTNMIEALNDDTQITEIYSSKMKKICELKNAILENKKEYIKIYNDEETKYISKEEKEISNIEILSENKIFAKKSEDKWGFVDINGNKVVDYKYEKVTEVNKYGFAGIKQNGKWGIINSEGTIIVEPTYELNSNEPIFIGEYYQVIYGNGEIYYTK